VSSWQSALLFNCAAKSVSSVCRPIT